MRTFVAFLAALAAVYGSAQPLPLPTPECCQALATSYGPNSTLPTRNCFCVPEYWEDLAAKQTHSTISLTTYLDSCSALGYPVYYYQAGDGPCSGMLEAPTSGGEEAAGAVDGGSTPEVMPLPMRSFGQWVRDLGDDGLILISFMVAVAAGVGGALMLWSFIYDLYASLSSKARKQV
ncbi:hypothetical protein N2152v2_002339 [Parachlorella kessleri]